MSFPYLYGESVNCHLPLIGYGLSCLGYGKKVKYLLPLLGYRHRNDEGANKLGILNEYTEMRTVDEGTKGAEKWNCFNMGESEEGRNDDRMD